MWAERQQQELLSFSGARGMKGRSGARRSFIATLVQPDSSSDDDDTDSDTDSVADYVHDPLVATSSKAKTATLDPAATFMSTVRDGPSGVTDFIAGGRDASPGGTNGHANTSSRPVSPDATAKWRMHQYQTTAEKAEEERRDQQGRAVERSLRMKSSLELFRSVKGDEQQRRAFRHTVTMHRDNGDDGDASDASPGAQPSRRGQGGKAAASALHPTFDRLTSNFLEVPEEVTERELAAEQRFGLIDPATASRRKPSALHADVHIPAVDVPHEARKAAQRLVPAAGAAEEEEVPATWVETADLADMVLAEAGAGALKYAPPYKPKPSAEEIAERKRQERARKQKLQAENRAAMRKVQAWAKRLEAERARKQAEPRCVLHEGDVLRGPALTPAAMYSITTIRPEVQAHASLNANAFLDQELSKLLAEREALLGPVEDEALLAALRGEEAPAPLIKPGSAEAVHDRMKRHLMQTLPEHQAEAVLSQVRWHHAVSRCCRAVADACSLSPSYSIEKKTIEPRWSQMPPGARQHGQTVKP